MRTNAPLKIASPGMALTVAHQFGRNVNTKAALITAARAGDAHSTESVVDNEMLRCIAENAGVVLAWLGDREP